MGDEGCLFVRTPTLFKFETRSFVMAFKTSFESSFRLKGGTSETGRKRYCVNVTVNAFFHTFRILLIAVVLI